MRNIAVLFPALAIALAAADKGPPTVSASNDRLALTATLYLDKDAVRQQLGYDLNGFIVVKVELTPKGSQPLAISHDDFLLRSYKDGQKSGAFAPTQIAGRAALVIGSQPGGTISADPGGPRWGGLGGGPPIRMPGPGTAPSAGNGAAAATTATATAANTGKKDDPLLTALQQKILPDAKTTKPVSGLLFFSIDGKVKPKDLALQYDGPAGPLKLLFR
jgi:hypothetical protein